MALFLFDIAEGADQGMQTVPDSWGPAGGCPRRGCGAAWERVRRIVFRKPNHSDLCVPGDPELFSDVRFIPRDRGLVPCAALVDCVAGHAWFFGPREALGNTVTPHSILNRALPTRGQKRDHG